MLQYHIKQQAKTERQVKLCAATCLGLGLIIASTFSSFYWDLSQRATLYTETQSEAASKLMYDNCGQAAPVDEDVEQMNTHWALVFKFNAIVYTTLTAMIMCSCTGLIYTNIFKATLNGLQLAGLAHVVAIALAGAYLFKTDGKSCIENETEYDTLGNSFETDGTLLKKLFISQCSLLIPFCMCACIGMRTGSTLGPQKNADDNYVRDY